MSTDSEFCASLQSANPIADFAVMDPFMPQKSDEVFQFNTYQILVGFGNDRAYREIVDSPVAEQAHRNFNCTFNKFITTYEAKNAREYILLVVRSTHLDCRP